LGTYGTFSGVPNPDPATNAVLPILPDDLSTQAVRGQLLAAGQDIANADWNIIIQEKNFASVTADVVWPILAGGKIRGAYDAAGVNVEMSKEDLRKTEADLMTELATRYYGLVLANEVADVRKKSYEFMKQHYENSQTLFENGMIPKLELLHASVSMAEAEREYSKAQRDVTIIHAGLMATLHLDSSQMVVPTSSLFMKSTGNTASHWVRSAIAHNPQLKQIDKKRSLVEIKSKVNRQQYLPALALMGSYNIAEADLSPYAPHWMFGLGMKWTVFNGFARSNNIKESKCMMDQIDHAEQKAHADIEAYLINLYQKLEMYREQKEQLELTLAMSKEYLASSEEAFNQGMANSLSVVDAQLKISQVEALILKSMYEYDVTMVLIYQTAGVPDEFKSITVNTNSNN
jgi:outer membrane protein TolC